MAKLGLKCIDTFSCDVLFFGFGSLDLDRWIWIFGFGYLVIYEIVAFGGDVVVLPGSAFGMMGGCSNDNGRDYNYAFRVVFFVDYQY